MFIVWSVPRVLLDTNSSFTHSFSKEWSFNGAPPTFSHSFIKEKFCVGTRRLKSIVRCSLSQAFRRPCRKNDISGYVWHKSFIKTVKCSFPGQRIVYQSFYGALLTFSYFFFKEKFCVKPCVGKLLARCLLFEAFRRPCRKNDISGYVWHKSFIKTVKCSIPGQRIVYQSFYAHV